MRWWVGASLAASTLLSEDAATIGTGVLVGTGAWPGLAAIAWLAFGIYLGDLGLFGLGRLARRWPPAARWMARRFSQEELAALAAKIEAHSAWVVFASRFLPGSRFAVYVGAGALSGRMAPFAFWTAVAAVTWSTVIVLTIAAVGGAAAVAVGSALAWLPAVGVPLAGALVWRLAGAGRWSRPAWRFVHWEFWPTWATYPPVVAWIAVLALRHRSLRPITAANPGFADGGLVGESKYDIQSMLPSRWAVPTVRIGSGALEGRAAELFAEMAARGWEYPVILKPDVGQRGVGVRKAVDATAARRYLAEYVAPVVAQPWHPGPFEAGIFYARLPNEPRGRILSITDKVFPVLIGDGVQTVGDLIRRHERFRLQSRVFLKRHAADCGRVLGRGERLPLAEVGNHAQGTLFLDGAGLWTAELEARVDAIARQVPGFHVGRFDVRYSDRDAFRRGDDLAIVELNGVTAEPTDIYDPSRSIVSAYRALFEQWRLVFAAGSANLRRGHPGASAGRLMRLGLAHLRDGRTFPVSS